MLEARARLLQESLESVVSRVFEIKGLVLVDTSGLPLVSTLGSPALEEGLAAFAAMASEQMARAQDDFQMGPLYLMHLAGRDRQVFLTPLTPEVTLIAIVEAGATSSTVTLHLLGMCREILSVLVSSDDDTTEGTP